MSRLKAFFVRYSNWILLSPYLILFAVFIVIPVICAIALSFTYFNTIQFPSFIGMKNYIKLLTQDSVFMQKVLPNTVKYSLFVGPGGYILSFILAWTLAQLTKLPRTILAIIIYSPSMTAGVIMATLWSVIFSGDQLGYVNSILIHAGMINEPVQWLQSPDYLMTIIIVVALWSSMGVGFLAMLAGVLNVNEELYEAAYIDGIRNRFQEIIYVTVPSMRPQMLFGAVMAIVGTFSAGSVGVSLSGSNPTPNYAGQVIVNHIEDYGFIRYEMGYAAAVSVLLLLIIWGASKFSNKLFADE